MHKQFSPLQVFGRVNRDAQGEFLLPAAPAVLHDLSRVEHTRRDGEVDETSRPIVSPRPWSSSASPDNGSVPPEASVLPQRRYVPVRIKFAVAVASSASWLALSTWLAWAWMHDLAGMAGWPLTIAIVAGIALIPGFMNAFLATSLLLDRRPARQRLVGYPTLSVLIAAYNEEGAIADTLRSLALQDYPGMFEA